MRIIYSICHPKKLGNKDQADAMVLFGNQLDEGARYDTLYSFSDLKKLKTHGDADRSVAVIWDNSLFSISLAMRCRMRGVKVVYYLHEPGGLGQKLVKDDPLFYSCANALGELLFRRVAHYVGIPRYDRMAHGDVFLPLPFFEDRPPPKPKGTLIAYLGARRIQRLHPLFNELAPLIRDAGFTPAYFPSAEYGRSTEEKFEFLSNCAAVWNAYGVPYNQSGVAYDAVMSSVPVISTAYEPFRPLFEALGLFHELRLAEGPEAVRQQMRDILQVLAQQNDRKEVDLAARSGFGGRLSFQRNWLPFFQSI